MIREIKGIQRKGYRMGENMFNIISYADDAILIMENENYIQILLFRFNNAYSKYNLKILQERTKLIEVSLEPVRCKLMVSDKIIKRCRLHIWEQDSQVMLKQIVKQSTSYQRQVKLWSVHEHSYMKEQILHIRNENKDIRENNQDV